MEVTLKDLYENLNTLPKSLYKQVNDFMSFLKSQNLESETETDELQKEEVRKRVKYLQNHPNQLISEAEMECYLKELDDEK